MIDDSILSGGFTELQVTDLISVISAKWESIGESGTNREHSVRIKLTSCPG